jgi:hypothetical protein
MATRWKVREKIGNVFAFIFGLYIVGAFINGWIIEPFFSTPPEPERCGPHHHIRPISSHREYDQMVTDYGCMEDSRWACQKASNSLTENELTDLGCPNMDR